MRRWIVVLLLALPLAYLVALAGEAALNDDPCTGIALDERSRVEYVEHWFPSRTDCRVTAPGGAVEVHEGGTTTFLAFFAAALLTAVAAAATGPGRVRAAGAVVAWLLALAVVFA